MGLTRTLSPCFPSPPPAPSSPQEWAQGGQALPRVGDAAAAAPTPLEAPEAPSPGAHDPCPEVTVEGATRSTAPKAEAPEAPTGHHEAEPEGSPQPNTPEVVPSGASPAAPSAGGRVQGFSQLRLDFDALRKRKGSPSCSGDALRPLKQRKYIAVDE
nr:translation initiation factor IF-2-like [Aegilops tauschii subsp. strangulata]